MNLIFYRQGSCYHKYHSAPEWCPVTLPSQLIPNSNRNMLTLHPAATSPGPLLANSWYSVPGSGPGVLSSPGVLLTPDGPALFTANIHLLTGAPYGSNWFPQTLDLSCVSSVTSTLCLLQAFHHSPHCEPSSHMHSLFPRTLQSAGSLPIYMRTRK